MTRDEIIDEMRAVDDDLLAFRNAQDILRARVQTLESTPERQALLVDWPVFKVLENGLIIAVVRCEGLLEDYQKLLDQELPDNVLKLERRP